MLVVDVIKALQKAKVKYAIVGGYAVALHGVVRGTVDLDLVISLSEKQMLAAESALKSAGFEARLPVSAKEVFMFREEYINNRNMVAWAFYRPNAPLDMVDIIITDEVRDLGVIDVKAVGLTLKVADIPSLIKLKQRAGRPQDKEDVKALKKILKGNLS